MPGALRIVTRPWCGVLVLWLLGCLTTACASGLAGPAELSAHGADACAACRMAVTGRRTAAQIVSPAEEPRFFDDLGCLRTYLREHPARPDARVYVADHRTGAWVSAASAVYARVTAVETPMGSHLLAWADKTSRRQDSSAGEEPSATFASVLARDDGASR